VDVSALASRPETARTVKNKPVRNFPIPYSKSNARLSKYVFFQKIEKDAGL
jgi:hypothetical protein